PSAPDSIPSSTSMPLPAPSTASGSCEPAVQHPASLLACRGEGPGALSLRGFDDVVVAARVVAVPPAAFQALGSGDDARMRVAQGDRPLQQPRRARRAARRGSYAQAVVTGAGAAPGALGAGIVRGREAPDRLVAQARAQAFAQLRPRQRLRRTAVEQVT